MAEKSFGRVIEDRRHALGLTQEIVAKKVGVKANYVGYLERGMRHPSQRVVERLSSALKLDPQELYLMANPRVRSLLGRGRSVANALSLWQQFVRNPTLQTKNGLTTREREALAQLALVDSATTLAGVLRTVKALRRGFGT